MANINAPKIKYFDSFAEEIKSKLGRLQALVERHGSTSGDYHEEILRTLLRNFLSKRFSVKKGFICAGSEHGQISKQIDLMVIDENLPMVYVFQEGDFAVVVPEAVVAVMEIKTTLNKEGFIESFENIFSAKSLMREDLGLFPANLTGIIFGYKYKTRSKSDSLPSDKTLDNWFKDPKLSKFKDKEEMAPGAVMFFTAKRSPNGLLVRGDKSARIGPGGKYYYQLIGGETEIKTGMDSQASRMSFVLQMIINACKKKQFNQTKIFERETFSLIQKDRIALTNKRFTFGEGISQFEIPK